MIALDTNVLLRFLVEDDEAQSEKAARLFKRAVAANEALFVSDVVLCETVWVLHSGYKFSRAQIANALGELFAAAHLGFRAPDELRRALDAFRGGKGDFSDYVIREHARTAGSRHVVTFDKALLKEAGFAAP